MYLKQFSKLSHSLYLHPFVVFCPFYTTSQSQHPLWDSLFQSLLHMPRHTRIFYLICACGFYFVLFAIFLLYSAWIQKGLLMMCRTSAFWVRFIKTVGNCSYQQRWWVNLTPDGVTRPTTLTELCVCVRVNTHACTRANKYPTVCMQMFSSHYLQQKKLYLSRRMQLPLALDLLIHQNSLALLHWCRESQMALPLYSCFPSSEMHHTESS